MNDLQDNRLVKTFEQLKVDGKKALLPFLSAGFPNLDTTAALLRECEAQGIPGCELGFPFSDPVADGPVIQNSYTVALEQGVTSESIFEMVREYRRSGGNMALAAMVSYSIVFRHGVEDFLRRCSEAGFDGMIIPDLPMEEAIWLEPLARQLNLCNILLVAPTTRPQRRIEIARHSTGFIYYVSVAGTTGQRDSLPQSTIDGVAELRSHVPTPICVGFGISNPRTVATVWKVADGAIVGSAIIKRLLDAREKALSPQQTVAEIGEFVSQLLKA